MRNNNKQGFEIGVEYQKEKYRQYKGKLEENKNCLIKALLLALLLPIILFIILI